MLSDSSAGTIAISDIQPSMFLKGNSQGFPFS